MLINIIMKLSTIYILKHTLPIDIVYHISSYEETTYKGIESDKSEIVELDECNYIYPMQYTLYSLHDFFDEIYNCNYFKTHWNNKILVEIISIIHYTNDYLYDTLYVNDPLLYLNYSENLMCECRNQINKTIHNINKLSGKMMIEF